MPDFRSPIEDLMLLAFKPNNVNAVMGIMHNPIRQMTEMQMKTLESLVWSIISMEGDPSKLPIAAGAFLIERLEDPVRMARIIMMNGTGQGGLQDVGPGR